MLKDRPATSRPKPTPKPTWAQSREGFKHKLVAALTAKGFSYREADKIISAIFESMKQAILRREPVELPFGTLRVIEKDTGRKWRFGRVIRFRPYKIILDTSKRISAPDADRGFDGPAQ